MGDEEVVGVTMKALLGIFFSVLTGIVSGRAAYDLASGATFEGAWGVGTAVALAFISLFLVIFDVAEEVRR